jgi:hypothetical protein
MLEVWGVYNIETGRRFYYVTFWILFQKHLIYAGCNKGYPNMLRLQLVYAYEVALLTVLSLPSSPALQLVYAYEVA